MAKRAGTYKGEKRRKELSRLKKQDEKRQRRLVKKPDTNEAEEVNPGSEVEESESATDDKPSTTS